MKITDYYNLLNSHDWRYQYRKAKGFTDGEREHQKITHLSKLSDDFMRLFSDFKKYAYSKADKPVLKLCPMCGGKHYNTRSCCTACIFDDKN
jgi:hypothetical protein